MAVLSAGLTVDLRDIRLKDKPPAFLAASASATVPTLVTGNLILDESLEIMVWALKQRDPSKLLDMPDEGWQLIDDNDGPFKAALDHTKYAVRYPDLDPLFEREKACRFVRNLDARLAQQPFLFGSRCRIADLAVFPFIRQFANIDRDWFDAQPWPHVAAWLERFLQAMRLKRPW